MSSVETNELGAENHRQAEKSDNIERWTNTLLVLFFLWDLLTVRKKVE